MRSQTLSIAAGKQRNFAIEPTEIASIHDRHVRQVRYRHGAVREDGDRPEVSSPATTTAARN